MRDAEEIAEKLGEAKTKYEQEQANLLKGEGKLEAALHWAHEMSLLQWVLGGEWVSYPVAAPQQQYK